LPDHSEAAELLADVYERTGFDEDLVELLNRQLDVAREGGDLEAFRAASIRLGALLASVNREQAMAVYRNALELLPEDRDLALALLELFGPDDDPRERAEIKARILVSETGETAAAWTMGLADDWQALDESDGVRAALEHGYDAHPDHSALRERLIAFYHQRGELRALTDHLDREATRLADPDRSVALWRDAARIHADSLGDASGAATMLARARGLLPVDMPLLGELTGMRMAAGEQTVAIDEVGEVLSNHDVDAD